MATIVWKNKWKQEMFGQHTPESLRWRDIGATQLRDMQNILIENLAGIKEMKNEKLLKRIEQLEAELEKTKKELNGYPTWEDLNVDFISIAGLGHFSNPAYKKMDTFAKLMAVAEYVNAKSTQTEVYFFRIHLDKYIDLCRFHGNSPYYFLGRAAALEAIEIFKANRSEQELIDFLR